MPEKVIILELTEQYALAMEEGGSVVRIRRREGLSPGDKVYILPEDYWQPPAQPIPLAAAEKPRLWVRRMAAAAAMLALVLILVLPMLPTKAYAVVSFDAKRGMQLQVDENYKILDAVSCDGSISSTELAQIKGKNLMDLGTAIPELLGKGPILIAYAPRNGQNSLQAEQQIRSLLADQELMYFSGNSKDISQADASSTSLGKYILSAVVDQEHMPWLEDLLEDYYDDDDDDSSDEEDMSKAYESLDADALLQVLKENPGYLKNEGFRELLADKLEDKHEQAEAHPQSEPDDDDDDDQDSDDDDDDDASDDLSDDDDDEIDDD